MIKKGKYQVLNMNIIDMQIAINNVYFPNAQKITNQPGLVLPYTLEQALYFL